MDRNSLYNLGAVMLRCNFIVSDMSSSNTVDEQLIGTDSDCNGHLESDITNLKDNTHFILKIKGSCLGVMIYR